MASSSSAASATVRARGPAATRPPSERNPDPVGTRPRDGLSPTSPVAAAGIRMEPPPSEPGATGSRPAATATAAPPLLPPAPSDSSQGVRAGGPTRDSVYAGRPNSGALVLPRLTPPASSSASTMSSETSGTNRSVRRDPKVVRTPARRHRSLSPSGSPHSAADFGTCCSTNRARTSAASGVTVVNAPRPWSSRSMRWR